MRYKMLALFVCITQVGALKRIPIDYQTNFGNTPLDRFHFGHSKEYNNYFIPKFPNAEKDGNIMSDLHHFKADNSIDDTFDTFMEKQRLDAENEMKKRKNIVQWFKDILSETPHTIITLDDDEKLKNLDVIPLNNDINKRDSFYGFHKLLHKLTQNLDKLNENIEHLNNELRSDGLSVVKLPVKPRSYERPVRRLRNRRDLEHFAISNETEVNNSAIENGTDTEVNKTDNINGRRFINQLYVKPPNDIKTKLLFYLDEAFREIGKKVEPLNELKKSISNDNNYRIGYILANIDTLDVTLAKLRREMVNYKHLWDDMKVLDVFDKLKTSDNVIASLLESLKKYIKTANY